MKPVELKPGQRLHDLLVLHDTADGLHEVQRLASVSVGGTGAEDTQLLGRKLADWAKADLRQELAQAFDVDPFTLLAAGWAQLRKVRKAVKASHGPPPQVQAAALLKHDLEARLSPRLVLNVGGVDWCDLRFTLSLKLTVEAAELSWLDGRLVSLRWVKPVGSVTLQCQGQDLAAFRRNVAFAPEYDFDPPLEWPHPAVADADG
jgi:hypothetical protein